MPSGCSPQPMPDQICAHGALQVGKDAAAMGEWLAQELGEGQAQQVLLKKIAGDFGPQVSGRR